MIARSVAGTAAGDDLHAGLVLFVYASMMLMPLVPLHIWRNHVLQTVVTQVDKNADGSMTYHFAVKMDPGETLTPGESKATADFVTVYNFYGLVDGSAKSPAGWEFSSEEFGRTPTMNGYPAVLPVDVPNTPNLTWTVTKPVAAGVACATSMSS